MKHVHPEITEHAGLTGYTGDLQGRSDMSPDTFAITCLCERRRVCSGSQVRVLFLHLNVPCLLFRAFRARLELVRSCLSIRQEPRNLDYIYYRWPGVEKTDENENKCTEKGHPGRQTKTARPKQLRQHQRDHRCPTNHAEDTDAQEH